MKILISGGCKNGKSTYAERLAVRLANGQHPLYYIATMIAGDQEDFDRIKRHQDSRKNCGFRTVEQGRDIPTVINFCDPSGSFLLDSVTALLANEMFSSDGIHRDAPEKVAQDLSALLSAVSHLVIVSDYIYSDAEEYDSLTEDYRRGLALLDRTCVALCDVVIEVCYGSVIAHKGAPLLQALKEELPWHVC